MTKRDVSRRRFLQTTGVAAATAMTARSVRAVAGANERLNIAVIGLGGQGRYDTRCLLEAGGDGVRLVAICDLDQQRLDDTTGEMKKDFGAEVEQTKEYRRIIDRNDVNIVIIATPDHWHAIPAVLACQAGKDVYVEKPLAHNVAEGRAMVAAARKYKRIVQVGQQQRSDDHFREAMAYLQNGQPLGRISRTSTFNYENNTPNGIGQGSPELPKQLSEQEYDVWLGPAPKRPYNSKRWHFEWRWFYDYGGGMICDWNVHIQDIVHWGMRVDAPRSVNAAGGKLVLTDIRDTPDIMDVTYEYPGFDQVYTMGKCYARGKFPEGYGTQFFGADGAMFINRSYWEVMPEMKHQRVDDPDKPGEKKTISVPRTEPFKKGGGDSGVPHQKNFLEAVRSRRAEDLHCDVEVGHRIATACHLGNISLRVGRKIWWDRDRERITQQDGTPDPAANVWLSREYRKGYELPEV